MFWDNAESTLSFANVDVIVVRDNLPDRDPFDWLEEISLARPEIGERILLLSGHAPDPDHIRRVLACGAAYLQEPPTLRQLHAAIVARFPRTVDESERPDRARGMRPGLDGSASEETN